MKTIDCLCFGACVVDTLEQTSQISIGGDAFNQALLLKRLGYNSMLCAGIGNDQHGEIILRKLQKFNISTDTMVCNSNWTTSHSLIHLDENGERSFTVTGGAHRLLEKQHFPFELLPVCKAISLGSMFTLHQLEEDGLKEIFQCAKENHCITFSDTSIDRYQKGLKKVKEFLPNIDYFMPSLEEAIQLTNRKEPDEIAQVLLKNGANTVVLKLGDKGAVLYRKDVKIEGPAYPSMVMNTTGAGDNFCAGFIASLLAGCQEKEALHNGCFMGARACEKNDTTSTDISHLPYPINK